MLQRAEGSFDAPSEAVQFPDFFRMELVFRKVCYDVLKVAVPDGEAQDAQGHFVFPIPFSREIVESHLLADVAVLVCRFRVEVLLF